MVFSRTVGRSDGRSKHSQRSTDCHSSTPSCISVPTRLRPKHGARGMPGSVKCKTVAARSTSSRRITKTTRSKQFCCVRCAAAPPPASPVSPRARGAGSCGRSCRSRVRSFTATRPSAGCRTTLLPLLNERLGARLRRDVLAQGRHAASDRRAWDQMLDLVPDLSLTVQREGFTVARASVCGYDNALSVALLRAAARRVGLMLGPTRARRLVELAQRPSGRRLRLGDGWSAEVAFDKLRVSRELGSDIDCALEHVWPSGEQGSARFGEFEITWAPAAAPPTIERATWTAWVDAAEWQVRAPARGDSLVPLGGVGHRPLKRLLMEARVPRSERPRYPVVSRGETILWVPGICRSAEGVPAPGTRAVRLDVIEYR